jgi:hypothetical protein
LWVLVALAVLVVLVVLVVRVAWVAQAERTAARKFLRKTRRRVGPTEPLLVRRSSAILTRPDFIDPGFPLGCA